jgi:hypothetical protein
MPLAKEGKDMDHKDWEQALADDYCSFRWARLLEPLCETFQGWKAGTIGYEEVDRALEVAYKEKCALNNLFCQRVDRIANLVRWWDVEWFEAWVEEHRPPAHLDPDQA